jgi:hypothetical protein
MDAVASSTDDGPALGAARSAFTDVCHDADSTGEVERGGGPAAGEDGYGRDHFVDKTVHGDPFRAAL